MSNLKLNMAVHSKVIPGSFEKGPKWSMTNHGLALCCSGTSRARPFSLGVEQTRVSQRDSLSAGSCICPPALLIDWGWHVIHQKTRPHSRRSVEQSQGADGERGRSNVAVVDSVKMKAEPTVSLAFNSHWTLPRAWCLTVLSWFHWNPS